MKNEIDRRSFRKKALRVGGPPIALPGIADKVRGAELKTGKPLAAARSVDPLKLPTGTIKHLEISRLICGGNSIGGWAHRRDLMCVSPLIKAYHADEKIFQILRRAEQRVVNTVLTNPSSSRVLKAYRDERGGRCDKFVRDVKIGEIESRLKFLQKERVPHRLGAHSLETVKPCVKAGFRPDCWVKTLHQDKCWSAPPAKNRGLLDEVAGGRSEHERHHDNLWCENAPDTIAFRAKLKRAWIAFKGLAAGATHPRQAFQWAFERGADFICVGMFDFQIVENAALAQRALAAV